ncbi:methionine-R-sulfoxide reductase B3, mitochondrial-like [Littorina saxatilis]|uniref:Peptide-methionine (R)-S-oxide reductase n=1 Tax=Littorina saxatilis TaxID=31220 RepID=A0AAN9APY7_9CAEN
MNILHAVSRQQEVSPKLKKLQASCREDGPTPIKLEKEELKKRLTPIQYRVTQEKGTESAYSGKFVAAKDEGVYNCVVCGNSIFASETKFDSKSGWPAFHDVVDKDKVILRLDTSQGMQRMEVKCGDCRAHLGHVFDDGPKPTGVRYCVNSCTLDFKKHTTV